MNLCTLKEKLNESKIPDSWYSINEICGCDIFVLRKVKNRSKYYDVYWEFFYVDERGSENNAYMRFDVESDACKFFFDKLVERKKNFKTHKDYVY